MIDAVAILRKRQKLTDTAFVELVVWRVPAPLRGSTHNFKYRLALVVDDVCVLHYDNEVGKGDHEHVGSAEYSYKFVGLDRLRADFLMDARKWLERHSRD